MDDGTCGPIHLRTDEGMTMAAPFDQPFMYWIGMDVRTEDPDELAVFNSFYNDVHMPEVVNGNGFALGHRYELLAPDPRGDFGPRYLAMYEIPGEEGVKAYLDRQNQPRENRTGSYTQGPPIWLETQVVRWRMIWRKLADSGPPTVPDTVFMVGIDAPEGASDEELLEFNDFYTNIHMHEAAKNMGYVRASRFELEKELLHPEPGCPQFCAVYEGDEARTAHTVDAGPTVNPHPVEVPEGERPYSQGPQVWRDHTTPWRLAYRRVGP
jgi:hypothetical protein